MATAGASIALVLIVGELPGYWVSSRLEHEREGLWRFHAVHHSAPRLYWLNAGTLSPHRLAILTLAPSYLLQVLLGCGEQMLAYFGLI